MTPLQFFRLRCSCVLGVLAFGLLVAEPAMAQPARVHFAVPQPDVFAGRPMWFYRVHQDRTGFLWMTTEEGLYRYDGYTFDAIPIDPADPYALPTTRVLGLAEDMQGRLWIGLDPYGLCRYDPRTGRFERFPLPDLPGAPYAIAVDAAGTVWFSTDEFSVFRFDPETRRPATVIAPGRLWKSSRAARPASFRPCRRSTCSASRRRPSQTPSSTPTPRTLPSARVQGRAGDADGAGRRHVQTARERPGFSDDREATHTLIERAGVACVPGGSFFADPEDGRYVLRFCYAKEMGVLEDACRRLRAAFAPVAV